MSRTFEIRELFFQGGPFWISGACGDTASALHAMMLLQVHQAKALKDLHEGEDPEVLKENFAESFAQQFLVIKHILPRWTAAAPTRPPAECLSLLIVEGTCL